MDDADNPGQRRLRPPDPYRGADVEVTVLDFAAVESTRTGSIPGGRPAGAPRSPQGTAPDAPELPRPTRGAGPDHGRFGAEAALESRSVPPAPDVSGRRSVDAVTTADLLLYALLRRGARGLRVEPDGYNHQVTLELPEANEAVATLPAELGDAVVARLAILAGCDVAATEQKMARFKVRTGGGAISGDSEPTELLVIIEPTRRGLEAEVKRLAGRRDNLSQAEELKPGDGAGRPPSISGRSSAYRIISEIGRGATGIVYRAEHAALGKPVAIKVLDARVAAIPEQAARFAREGRAACRARHTGIVDVTDFGTLKDGRAFLVMELVEGRTLQTVIDQEGALDPPRAVAITRQVASALEAAHASGIVHRDVKPANIFVGAGDLVKIGDFGAAKIVEPISRAPSDTQSKRLVGTPYYMAPEHALGESTDRRSDVYSLGCVLFTLLAGHVPFEGTKVPDVLAQHITSPAPQAESPYGPLPVGLRQIVARALAKRPEERYQSAAEMLGDLERVAQALSRSDWRRWLPL